MPLMMPVLVLLREHGELWRAMDALEAEVDTYASEPDDAARAGWMVRRNV